MIFPCFFQLKTPKRDVQLYGKKYAKGLNLHDLAIKANNLFLWIVFFQNYTGNFFDPLIKADLYIEGY